MRRKDTRVPYRKSLSLKILGITFALSAVLAVFAVTAVLAADAYPSKPIRLIVATVPGGANDANARVLAAELTERLGKQVVVDNRGGGGGVIGTEIASKAEPDGYTLLFLTTTHSIQPALQKLPYDTLKAFTPIARTSCGTMVLAVHPSVAANSVKEFIALAKQKPGELLFSSAGTGTYAHLSAEFFKIVTGTDFRIEQFKSEGPAVTELVGGHSNATIGAMASVLPHIKSGRLRALGTTGETRHFTLPDVPTLAESGIPGFSSTPWRGLTAPTGFYGVVAPAGTPAPIIERLNKEIKTIMASPEAQKRFRDRGTEPCYLSTAEFGPFIEREIAKWIYVVKEAHITLSN